MDDRIDPKKSGRLKDNITRFRQDKRLAVAGALRTLGLLGMLAIAVYCVFQFHEDLAPDNLRRMVSYLQAAGSVSDPFTEYRFEVGLDTDYAPFGSGLAVVSGDTYSYVSGLGDKNYAVQLDYRAPALCVSDKYVLIYDRGGRSLCVEGSYTEYLRETLSSPIVSASMNRQGAFAVVTNEEGCRSAVAVYSAKQKMLCKWLTSQYYVLSASVSPESDAFAVLCLSQSQFAPHAELRYFTVGSEEADWVYDLGEKQVYSVTHDKSGGLLILWEQGVIALNAEGKRTGEQSFSQMPARFAVTEGGDLAVVLEGGPGLPVWVMGEKAEILWKGTFSGTLHAVDCRGGTVSVLTGDTVYSVPYASGETAIRRMKQKSARDLIVDENGSTILVYSDRAEKIDFDGEAEA